MLQLRRAIGICSAFLVFRPAVLASETCSWCEAGPCNQSGLVVKDGFAISISSRVGRSYPYWRPTEQVRLGESSADAWAAFVVHHGADRNGDDYTRYAMNGSPEGVLVFGAQVYEAGDDGLDEDKEIWWDSNNDDGIDDASALHDWHWGGESTDELAATTSSFEVLDEMVSTLLNTSLYPKLTRVILGGHSAGGQLVQRYALLTRLKVDQRLRFFVANPSSVVWLTDQRPTNAQSGLCCDNATIMNQTWHFAEPAGSSCTSYNDYGYGLAGALPPYTASRNMSLAIASYKLRDVTYMSGESDICDSQAPSCATCVMEDGGLDTSCEAREQGACRMARLHAFARFVDYFYGESDVHALVSVPGVGHSGCAMFQSGQFIQAAFPEVTAKEKPYKWFCSPNTADYCKNTSLVGTSSRITKAGTVLMGGGTDVDAAFKWQVARANGGNFLVLRESGDDAYNSYIWRLAREFQCGGAGLAAVATLVLDSRGAGDDAFVLSRVRAADAVFFAGGDQSKYVERIGETALDTLLRERSANITIGGTSAGNAIQGHFVYTGVEGSAISSECLHNPYNPDLGPGSLVGSLLNQKPLIDANVIMDDHFVNRDRMGRLVTFLARLAVDRNYSIVPRGIGVDEMTALLVDGNGSLVAVGEGHAYLCEIAGAVTCTPHQPLTVHTVRCQRLRGGSFADCDDPETDRFDLYSWTGSGVNYTFDVRNGQILSQAYGPA